MARSLPVLAVGLIFGPALSTGAAPGQGARPVFEYASDSLQATLTLIGGRGAQGGDPAVADGRQVACGPGRDSTAPGASPASPAWYEVSLRDEKAGMESRFPIDEAALRKGLRKACEEGGQADPARIAAGLRALAVALRVRMRTPANEAGE